MQQQRGVGAPAIVGIVLVSILMAASLIFSLLLGFGSLYVCQEPESSACISRYETFWRGLLGLHLVAIIVTIVLWTRRRTRPAGFVVGTLGTAGAAIAFTIVFEVPL